MSTFKSKIAVLTTLLVLGCCSFMVGGGNLSDCFADETADVSSEGKWDSFALLLIDVQNHFWNRSLRAGFPDFPDNVTALLSLCRANGIEVIHLRARFSADKSDWPSFYALKGRMPCVEGSEGEKIVPFAQEEQGELIIHKHSFDGFLDTSLEEYLEANNKKHLLLAGIATDVCVLSTAFTAFQKGYLLTLVTDCTAGSPIAHNFITKKYDGFLFENANHDTIIGQHSRWLKRIDQLLMLEESLSN